MADVIRLGINIDHIATVRNARGGLHPCPVRGAMLAMEAGADGITAHLREDRRHIKDHDIERLKNEVPLPLNLEMAMTDEMLAIALRIEPHAVCIVPEKREEVTTEGGLDVVKLEKSLIPFVKKLQDNGSRVSLFIDPVITHIESAKHIGSDIVELHTGRYAELFALVISSDAERSSLTSLKQDPSTALRYAQDDIIQSAKLAYTLGLEVHAGHGLTFDNVKPIAAIPEIMELNIGHFLMGESMFVGMREVVSQMKRVILSERKRIEGSFLGSLDYVRDDIK